MRKLITELRQMVDQLILGDDEVLNWIKKSKVIKSVVRLPGDASTRRYYRITADIQSYILMQMEAFPEKKDSLPFLSVQKHLASSGVDVPQVLDVDAEKGFILLEDLGDVTLLRSLQEVDSPDLERHIYEKVIDSLVQLQVHACPTSLNQNQEFFKLRFDHEKLMWEMNFAIENFYQLYLKRNLSEYDLKIMTTGLSEICGFLADQPTVLAHRDFHSRNIMILNQGNTSKEMGQLGRFVMIDFQDARMGPCQYDLASLLRDSYYQLQESQISTLLDYYIARYEAMSDKLVNRSDFHYVFDLMAIQRNFKAIGSFASFMNRRGDPSYLKYIGNTFENIRRTLLKYPKFSKLREVVFHYYYF